MAKPTFSKLKLQLTTQAAPVQIGEQTIAVRTYLPIQEKLKLIGNVVNQAHEPNSNYNNPVKTDVYMALEMVFAYTDLVFTDKQKEDIPKLYDLLKANGILDVIFNAIPEAERYDIERGVYRTIESVYAYQNSAMGILENIKMNQDMLQFDIEQLKEELANSENLGTVKEVLSKLG